MAALGPCESHIEISKEEFRRRKVEGDRYRERPFEDRGMKPPHRYNYLEWRSNVWVIAEVKPR